MPAREFEPYHYRLRERLDDYLWGRRHGRTGIPAVPVPVPTEDEDDFVPLDGVDVFSVHLAKLRELSADSISQVRLAFEHEAGMLRQDRAAAVESIVDLGERHEGAKKRLVASSREPQDEDLKERRTHEAHLSDRLVRDRRWKEWDAAYNLAVQARSSTAKALLAAVQEVRRLDEREAALEAEAAARAQRIHHYYCRRAAAYWAQVVRHHPAGPRLNSLLQTVGPQMPDWVTRLEAQAGSQPESETVEPDTVEEGE